MSKVVDLNQARAEKAAKKAFAPWRRRIDYSPPALVTLATLPDLPLGRLGELDQNATYAFYDLVLGVRDWGVGEDFYGLPPDRKVVALDVFLVLADQTRFEIMRRLNWVEPSPLASVPLIRLAARHRQLSTELDASTPAIKKDHPRFKEFAERLVHEPGAVVRSLIPEALTRFRHRVSSNPPA